MMEGVPETALDRFGVQSALEAAGPGASAILDLTTAMTAGFGAVFLATLALVWFAWLREREAGRWWVWGGGIVLPVVSIMALMGASTTTLLAITRPAPEALTIDITGHQFWWDIVYDPDERAIRDANELVLPAGRPVTIRLRSNDVIHSFWIPSAAGKMDMIPGRTNTLTLTATRPGRYRGQCAEFCGLSHPKMAFEVIVLPAEDFDRWLDDFAAAAREPTGSDHAAGREVFLDAGCAGCHAIRGVAAGGRLGPDLTRVGGRGSLGAGMWRMNEANLADWIANAAEMKPGAQMPVYEHLSGSDLRAVATYLASLG